VFPFPWVPVPVFSVTAGERRSFQGIQACKEISFFPFHNRADLIHAGVIEDKGFVFFIHAIDLAFVVGCHVQGVIRHLFQEEDIQEIFIRRLVINLALSARFDFKEFPFLACGCKEVALFVEYQIPHIFLACFEKDSGFAFFLDTVDLPAGGGAGIKHAFVIQHKGKGSHFLQIAEDLPFVFSLQFVNFSFIAG